MAIQFDNTNTGTATLRPATTGTIALTLPSADGTSGQALTTNGSGQLAFTTVGGGGGLTGFTAAESTTAPNNTVNVDSLTASAASTDADVAFVAKGTGATLAQVPDSAAASGNKRGTYATDFQKVRTAATQVASGEHSSILGGRNNTASGPRSVVAGGSTNTASASASGAFGGAACIASGIVSSTVGGESNTASGNSSFCGGGYGASSRAISGMTVFSASSAPFSLTSGVCQSAILVLGRQTSTSTPLPLASTADGAGTTNQVILPNNSAYFFRGEVIAGVTGAGNTKGWTIEGVIKRGANAASTTLVGVTVMSSYGDAGAVTWVVAVTADTTNGGLAITVTGAAATTIRWVAQIRTTEMTF
jgi:hypothetical protein